MSGPQTLCNYCACPDPAPRAWACYGFAVKVCEENIMKPWVQLRARVPTSVAPGSEAAVATVTTEGAGPRSKGTQAHWPHKARRAHGAGRASGRCHGPVPRTPRTALLGAGRSPVGKMSWGGSWEDPPYHKPLPSQRQCEIPRGRWPPGYHNMAQGWGGTPVAGATWGTQRWGWELSFSIRPLSKQRTGSQGQATTQTWGGPGQDRGP